MINDFTPSMSIKTPTSVRVGLAPMEGVTDLAVRQWFALTSPPDFAWTPFLRVTDTFPAKIPWEYIPEQMDLKDVSPFQVIAQLMGSDVDHFSRAADLLLGSVSYVDLNCGCPSPTVVGNKAGSSLLENASEFSRFVETASTRLGARRLSVKMRTGFHDSQEFRTLVSSIAGLPLAHLTVHGRTRPQRYKGQADWNLIDLASRICRNFSVIGSGDICDEQTLQQLLSVAPEVKKVIVGRGALRNPWIFGPIRAVPLLEPLVAFALLQHAGIEDVHRLGVFAKDGGLARVAGDDRESWIKTIVSLLKINQMNMSNLTEIEVSPRAFARTKMLWSYFRSSLPACFMTPTLLRAKNLSDFTRHLEELASSDGIDLERVALKHNPSHDWMYSGQGKSSS